MNQPGQAKMNRMWYGVWDGKVQVHAYRKEDVLFLAREAGFKGQTTKLHQGFYIVGPGETGELSAENQNTRATRFARVIAANAVIDEKYRSLIEQYRSRKGEKDV